MPEGPSIVILHDVLLPFKGKKVISASGYAGIDFSRLEGQKIIDLKTWGKHTLICFKNFTVRIHLMMFGSYTINEGKKYNPKLSLHFVKDEVNFYLCQVAILDEPLSKLYDWAADVMGDKWSVPIAKRKLKDKAGEMICDVLLDQKIFSGVGNIIKNEVLFRTRIHPDSITNKLPPSRITEILEEVRKYAFEFLKWKRAGTLSKHWEAYEQKVCPRCDILLHKKKTGKGKRQSYFCNNCQILYK